MPYIAPVPMPMLVKFQYVYDGYVKFDDDDDDIGTHTKNAMET